MKEKKAAKNCSLFSFHEANDFGVLYKQID